jgi:predicted NBD/HSP70 family sugar kinase
MELLDPPTTKRGMLNMGAKSTLRLGAHSDEASSLLRIVNLVRTGEAITRPELVRATALNRSVVTQRVDQAVRLGYLADGEFGPSSGGRAPRILRFRGEQGHIIVCALGALHIRVGIAALDGDILDHTHRPWDIGAGPDETLEAVMGLIDELLKKASEVPVWSVVVGLPGPVDFASGRPVAPPNMLGWDGFDVRAPFENRYAAPVWVDNDVNLLALAEHVRHRNREDLIYCKFGSGIGAGLLSQGQIHRGALGSAGDIGHLRVPDSMTRCRCGRIGCLEAEAGGRALVRLAEQGIENGHVGPLRERAAHGKITVEDITLAARAGDPLATSLLIRTARIAGQTIATLINIFNPSVIVIGGVLASAGEVFLAEVRQRVYELSLPLATRDLTIIQSVGDVREPLRGGAELARAQLFDVTFPRWFANGRPSPAM